MDTPDIPAEPLLSTVTNAARLRFFCSEKERVARTLPSTFLGDLSAYTPEDRHAPKKMADVRTSDVLKGFQGEAKNTSIGTLITYVVRAVEIYAKHFHSTDAEHAAALDRMCTDIVDFLALDIISRDSSLNHAETAAILTKMVADEAKKHVEEAKRAALTDDLSDNIVGLLGEEIVKRDPEYARTISKEQKSGMISRMVNDIDHKLQELLGFM